MRAPPLGPGLCKQIAFRPRKLNSCPSFSRPGRWRPSGHHSVRFIRLISVHYVRDVTSASSACIMLTTQRRVIFMRLSIVALKLFSWHVTMIHLPRSKVEVHRAFIHKNASRIGYKQGRVAIPILVDDQERILCRK